MGCRRLTRDEERLPAHLGDVDLPRHDPTDGQAIGIKSDSLQLFKHPLTHDQAHAVGVAHRYPRREKGTWESR